jgi:hypothetical protein
LACAAAVVAVIAAVEIVEIVETVEIVDIDVLWFDLKESGQRDRLEERTRVVVVVAAMAAGKNYETEVAAAVVVAVEMADALEGDCKKRDEPPEPEQVWRVPRELEQELEDS